MLGIMLTARIRLPTALAAPCQHLGVLLSIKVLVFYAYHVETLNTFIHAVQAHHIMVTGMNPSQTVINVQLKNTVLPLFLQ